MSNMECNTTVSLATAAENNRIGLETNDQPIVPIVALENPKYQAIYENRFHRFNSFVSEAFNGAYKSNANLLISAPMGSGKTTITELTLLRLFNENANGRCLYIVPKDSLAELMYMDWATKFGGLQKKLAILTGDYHVDISMIQSSHIVIASASRWEVFSRKWRNTRTNLWNIDLLIIDEFQLIDDDGGAALQYIIARALTVIPKIRIVAVAESLANYEDVAHRLRVSLAEIFHLDPYERPIELEQIIYGIDIDDFEMRLMTMVIPTFNCIDQYAPSESVIIFAPTPEQTILTVRSFQQFLEYRNTSHRFLHATNLSYMKNLLDTIVNEDLKWAVSFGMAFLHEKISFGDCRAVEELFQAGIIQVLIVTQNFAWSLAVRCHLSIVMDTCRNNHDDECTIQDITRMTGFANCPVANRNPISVVLCHKLKKKFYEEQLSEPQVLVMEYL